MPKEPFDLEVTTRDWELSGPDVWPRVTCEEIVDRFLTRRIELYYRIARRRIIKERLEAGIENVPEVIETRCISKSRGSLGKYKMSKKIKSFQHVIEWDDDREDVIKFLKELRSCLIRFAPKEPSLTTSIQVGFRDGDSRGRKYITSYQDRWI